MRKSKHLAVYSMCMGFKFLGTIPSMLAPIPVAGTLAISLATNLFIAFFSPLLNNKRILMLSLLLLFPSLIELPSDISKCALLYDPFFEDTKGYIIFFSKIDNFARKMIGVREMKVDFTSWDGFAESDGYKIVIRVLRPLMIIQPIWLIALAVPLDFALMKIFSKIVRWSFRNRPRFKQFIRTRC